MIQEIQFGQSMFSIDLEKGGQWRSLVLKSQRTGEPISLLDGFTREKDFFSCGSFVMFPFVNRSEFEKFVFKGKSYDFSKSKKDQNNLPLHGLVSDTPRQVVNCSKTNLILETSLTKNPDEKLCPQIQEKFHLTESKLEVLTTFENHSMEIQYFAFGYHPYFSFFDSIDDCLLESNLGWNVLLDDRLLPKKQFQKIKPFQNLRLISTDSFDHTFFFDESENERYFSITDLQKKIKLTLSHKKPKNSDWIDLKFLQIYTPKHRRSIAVEPMSSTGNSFFFEDTNLIQIFPGRKKYSSFSIQLE